MNQIKKGDIVPPFTTEDIDGNQVSLEHFRGKKVLLTFYRVASCPFCNLRVNQVIQKHAVWKEHNLHVIAVFASSADEIKQYAGKQDPPFAIIADPEEKLYKRFGIQHSRLGMLMAMFRMKRMIQMMAGGFFSLKSMTQQPVLPADFLIDEEGCIANAYYGKDFGDHVSVEVVEEWVGSW